MTNFSRQVATVGLALLGLVCVVGAIILSLDGSEVPEVLVVTAGASVGGLAGLAVPQESAT